MSQVFQDIRFALRVMRAAPATTLAAIVSLTLGIAATTSVFSVVDGVLLRPLPVADESRVLVVTKVLPDRAFDDWPFSYDAFKAMRDRLTTLTGVAAYPYSGARVLPLQT